MNVLDPVWRFIGLIAATNNALWRFRINFIPLNCALIAALAFGVYAGYEELQDASSNPEAAAHESLAALLNGGQPAQTYVSLAGVLVPKARIEYGKKGSSGKLSRIDKTWAPLVDRHSQKAMFVELTRRQIRDTEAVEVAIEGMLRPLDDDLKKELASEGFMLSGIPIERRYMLVEGGRPGTVYTGALLTGACGVTLVMFAFASWNRNTIFVPSAAPFAAGASAVAPTLFVSGKLYLSQDVKQRFCNMPAGVSVSEGGDLMIVSNIDASSSFMGMKTSDRSGLWTMSIRRGSVTDATRGYLYAGMKKLPAIRFRYTSAADGTIEQAVLAATGADPMLAVQG